MTASFDLATLGRALGMYESGWCQRTRGGVQSWQHTSDGGFNPAHFKMVPLSWKVATEFVTEHHYSGSYAMSKLRYGMVRRTDDALVGVGILGCPQSDKVITNPLPTLDRNTAAEWNRLVLLDEVPGNAESWFGEQALRDARKQGVKAIVTFADPVPRPEMPGHVGIVYQALNFDYLDRATGGDLLVLPDDTVLTRRTVQKIRKWERGAGGVVRRFVAAGAPPPLPGEKGAAYLRRATAAVRPRVVEHPGNHRFVRRLGSSREQARIPYGDGYQPLGYPKQPDPMPVYR